MPHIKWGSLPPLVKVELKVLGIIDKCPKCAQFLHFLGTLSDEKAFATHYACCSNCSYELKAGNNGNA